MKALLLSILFLSSCIFPPIDATELEIEQALLQTSEVIVHQPVGSNSPYDDSFELFFYGRSGEHRITFYFEQGRLIQIATINPL